MQRTLISTSFIFATLAVFAAFLTATTYAQLTIAILIYPVLIYFAFRAFPRKTSIDLPETQVAPPIIRPDPKSEELLEEPAIEKIGIADIDKRVFLKLIGGAGLTMFILSIFNKKAEGLFFKNLPVSGTQGSVALLDTTGKKIDPAKNHPTDGYRICEIDDNIVAFYGFNNKDGAWYIMKEDTDIGSFRYSRGDSNFPGSWNSRENLKYDYFNDVF